ncbi:MAG: hypothetical protein KAS15_00525, partial [Nanoarchaeota archaeon]|nr:hypothetical protein [Nanoarchaeota archaeon]
LEEAKRILKGELDTTKNNLNTKISELSSEKRLTRELNDTIKAKEADIKKWKDLYDAEVVEHNRCETRLDDCDDDLDACEAACP